MSDHRKKQQGARQGKPGDNNREGQQRDKRGFCGRSAHPRDECPAREQECNHCKMKGHIAAKCRKKRDGDKKKVAELSAEPVKSTINTLEVEEVDEEFAADVFRLSVAEDEQDAILSSRSSQKDSLGLSSTPMVGALGKHGRIPHQLHDCLGRW